MSQKFWQEFQLYENISEMSSRLRIKKFKFFILMTVQFRRSIASKWAMAYKLFRKSIYNLVGQMPKVLIVPTF